MRTFETIRCVEYVNNVQSDVFVSTRKKWTIEEILDELEYQKSKKERQILEILICELEKRKIRLWFGEGIKSGSIVLVYDIGENNIPMFGICTNGKIDIYFHYFRRRTPFNKYEKRKELLDRLNDLGLSLPESKIDLRPGFEIGLLDNDTAFSGFINIFDWFIEEVDLAQK